MADIKDGAEEIQDRLADLGRTINTNEEFGMMGYLKAQQDQANPPATTASDTQSGSSSGQDDSKIPEWVPVLNTSIQAAKQATEQNFQQIRGEIASMRQQPQQQQQADDTDPSDRKYQEVEQRSRTLAANSAWQVARGALNALKVRHPDAELNEDDLKQIWAQHNLNQNVDAAVATDWDNYLLEMHKQRRAPKLEAENSKMRAELERYKSGQGDPLNDLGAVPRANRQTASPQQSSQDGEFDEDLYRRAVLRMGDKPGVRSNGKFKGFGRIIAEERMRKSLSRAV